MVQITNSTFLIIPSPRNDAEIMKHLEIVSRTCYKSEGKMGVDVDGVSSDKYLIKKLVTSKHWAMMEHWGKCFEVDVSLYEKVLHLDNYELLHLTPIVKTSFINPQTNTPRYLLTMNLRVIYDIAYYLHVYEFAYFLKNAFPILYPQELFHTITNGAIIMETNPIIPDTIIREMPVEDMTAQELPYHSFLTVKFICDRGVTHEAVRNRGSFAQESQRFVNYHLDKYNKQITVIPPLGIGSKIMKCSESCPNESCTCAEKSAVEAFDVWWSVMEFCEKAYNRLIELQCPPELARSVLPNSTKTEINITFTLNHWVRFLEQRCSPRAHLDFRRLTLPLLDNLHEIYPIVFEKVYRLYEKDIEAFKLQHAENIAESAQEYLTNTFKS